MVDTKAVIERSALDFVDLHTYPGFALALPQYMQNFGVSGPSRKPLVIGEMGGFKSAYDTADRAAAALAAWQAASCPYGVQGWLIWTWDTTSNPSFGTRSPAGRRSRNALSPARRPDPCAPAGLATSRSGSPSPHPTKASTRPPTRSTATRDSLGLWRGCAAVDRGRPRRRRRRSPDPADRRPVPDGPTDHRVLVRGPNPGDPTSRRRAGGADP